MRQNTVPMSRLTQILSHLGCGSKYCPSYDMGQNTVPIMIWAKILTQCVSYPSLVHWANDQCPIYMSQIGNCPKIADFCPKIKTFFSTYRHPHNQTMAFVAVAVGPIMWDSVS